MGISHVLMVALLGITYGWQSDGNGGVEYIVQLSPDELKQIDRIGEISSEIDPAVAGHVSRIKIRVGSGPLPREAPRFRHTGNSTSQRMDLATSDRSAIPIPEMVDRDRAVPIAGFGDIDQRAVASSAQSTPKPTAMMKPDPQNGAAGPGLQLPSFPDTTARASQNLRDEIDQAGRNIAGFGKNAIDSAANQASNSINNRTQRPNSGARVPAPGTRTPNPNLQNNLPPFAGNNPANNRATTLSGGPSTEPTRPRDQSWNNHAGRPPNGPNTNEVDSNRMRFTDPRTKISRSINAANANQGSSGQSPSGTFGQLPTGLNLPNRPGPNQNTAQNRILSQQQQMEFDRRQRNSPGFEFANQDSPESLFDRTRAAARENGNANNLRQQNSARRVQDERQQNPSRLDLEAPSNRQFATEPATTPDRRLTTAELAAGAWGFDRYGNRVDRYGRRISMPVPNGREPEMDRASRPDSRYDYARSRATLDLPSAIPSYNDQNYRDRQSSDYERNRVQDPRDDRYQTTLAMQNLPPGEASRQSIRPDQRSDQRSPRGEVVREPESQSDRVVTTARASSLRELPKTASKHVAAQPFFNGLLLMSFVANIYLMFWLKNLRVRFRDMVAAKRLANANTQPV